MIKRSTAESGRRPSIVAIATRVGSFIPILGLLLSCAIEVGPAGGMLDLSPEATQGERADRIVVSWPKVRGAESYRVYACDVDVGLYVEASDGAIDGTSLEYEAVLPYFAYFFRVSAIEGGVESPLSRSCMGWVAPASPSVTAKGTGLELSWDGIPGVEYYRLEFARTPEGPFYTLNTSDASLVIEDPAYSYIAGYDAFIYDPSEPRHSAALRTPGVDVWFRIRAVYPDAEEGQLRSRGVVVAWSAP